MKPEVLAVGPLKHKQYRLSIELQPQGEPRNARDVSTLVPMPSRDVGALLVMQAPRDENERVRQPGIRFERGNPPSGNIRIVDDPQRRGSFRVEDERRTPSNFYFEGDSRRSNFNFQQVTPSNFAFQNTPQRDDPLRLRSSEQLRPKMGFYNDGPSTERERPKLKMGIVIEGELSAPKPAPRRVRKPKLRVSQSLQGEAVVPEEAVVAAPAPFIPNAFMDDGSATEEIRTASRSSGPRMWLVALDAGHGGADPGALGYYGSYEKNITLAIARRVQALLAQSNQVRGVLIRSNDEYVALADRVARAHQSSADLFVSIHADAFVNSSAKGSSVFMLSRKGASSAAASWLADRENNADLIGAVSSTPSRDPLVMRTLLDLSQTATAKDSQKLASLMLRELGALNPLHRSRVEQAGFAVLKSPSIPSILVETAFISNPQEEARLNNAAYQDDIAQAIVRGILRYFSQNPNVSRPALVQRS